MLLASKKRPEIGGIRLGERLAVVTSEPTRGDRLAHDVRRFAFRAATARTVTTPAVGAEYRLSCHGVGLDARGFDSASLRDNFSARGGRGAADDEHQPNRKNTTREGNARFHK